MSSDGAHVYVLAGLELIAFTRDAATGTLTENERDDVPGAGGPASLGLSPDATLVYAVGGVEQSALAVFARDPGTGSLSLIEVEFDGVNGVEGLFLPTSVAPSPDGRHVYVTAQGPGSLVTFAVDGAIVTTTTHHDDLDHHDHAERLRPRTPHRLPCRRRRQDGAPREGPAERRQGSAGHEVGGHTGRRCRDPVTATDYTFCLRPARPAAVGSRARRAALRRQALLEREAGRLPLQGPEEGPRRPRPGKLQADGGGTATPTVIGSGPNLSLPSLPLVDRKLVAQLVANGGVCFEDPLSAVRNDGRVVEAVID